MLVSTVALGVTVVSAGAEEVPTNAVVAGTEIAGVIVGYTTAAAATGFCGSALVSVACIGFCCGCC